MTMPMLRYPEELSKHTYILDKSGGIVNEPDLLKWAQWFAKVENRIIKRRKLRFGLISVNFLGVNCGLMSGKPPIFWEVVISSDENQDPIDVDIEIFRFATMEMALGFHDSSEMILKVCRSLIEFKEKLKEIVEDGNYD